MVLLILIGQYDRLIHWVKSHCIESRSCIPNIAVSWRLNLRVNRLVIVFLLHIVIYFFFPCFLGIPVAFICSFLRLIFKESVLRFFIFWYLTLPPLHRQTGSRFLLERRKHLLCFNIWLIMCWIHDSTADRHRRYALSDYLWVLWQQLMVSPRIRRIPRIYTTILLWCRRHRIMHLKLSPPFSYWRNLRWQYFRISHWILLTVHLH